MYSSAEREVSKENCWDDFVFGPRDEYGRCLSSVDEATVTILIGGITSQALAFVSVVFEAHVLGINDSSHQPTRAEWKPEAPLGVPYSLYCVRTAVS